MSDHQKCRKRIRRWKHEKKEEARPVLGKPVFISESQRKNLTISIKSLRRAECSSAL
jgi:hypothetical protein